MKLITKNNIKETILFIIKSAIFLCIIRYLYINVFDTIDFFSFLLFGILNVIPDKIISGLLIIFFNKFLIYLYMNCLYFTAKKLGIIKVLDKSPIWLVVLILIVYEFILTFYPSYNFNNENWILLFIHKYPLLLKEMLKDCIFGEGFIYTFIAYKIGKFLINKYPELSFLKKLYILKKLENVITFKNIFTPIKNCISGSFSRLFLGFINWWKKNFRWR